MREYDVDKTVKKVICNMCGKELKIENGVVMEGRYTCEYQWGYFSEKDGQIHRFDLCEECYDKITAGFIIPPDITENPELI